MDFRLLFVCIFMCSMLIVLSDSTELSEHREYSDEYNMNDDECECGKSNFLPDTVNMVINGVLVAPYNKYPWMVSLTLYGFRLCGGVMLNEYYILTASHCLRRSDYIKQFLRISFLSEDDNKPTEMEIAEYILHPDREHDIALAKLKKPKKCDEYSSPICLPPDGFEVPVGSIYHITGWGRTNVTKRVKDMLEGGLEVLDITACERVEGYEDFKDNKYCCVGAFRSGPCNGDSGGPMFKLYGNKFFTFGIAASITDATCNPDKIFLYTSVPLNMKWIQENSDVKTMPITEEMANPQYHIFLSYTK